MGADAQDRQTHTLADAWLWFWKKMKKGLTKQPKGGRIRMARFSRQFQKEGRI